MGGPHRSSSVITRSGIDAAPAGLRLGRLLLRAERIPSRHTTYERPSALPSGRPGVARLRRGLGGPAAPVVTPAPAGPPGLSGLAPRQRRTYLLGRIAPMIHRI